MSNPTLFVAQLSSDLAYADRSVGGLLSGVEPIRFSGGLWLEESGVNYCTNPSGETGTGSWGGVAGSVSVVTDNAKYGSKAIHWQRTTATGYGVLYAGNGSRPSVSEGEVWSIATTIVGTPGLPLSLDMEWRTGADGSGTVVTTDRFAFTASATPTDIVLTASAPATAASFIADIAHLASGTIGDFWNVDGWTFTKSAYLTSYIDGDQNGGNGYDWSGTAHASTSTRAASSASISPSGILAPGSGAVAFRVTPTIETGVEEIWGECGTKGAGTDHIQWGRDSTKHPFVEWSSNDAAYQRLTGSETLSAGTAYDVYFGWNGTAIELAVDAGTLQTGTRAAVSGDFSTGDLTLEASAGGVIYQPFATFSRTLTAKEIATLNGKNNWTMKVLAGNPYRNFQLRPY